MKYVMGINDFFLDADGVLADFDKYGTELFNVPVKIANWDLNIPEFWETIYKDRFYEKLPLMPDAMELYNAVKHLKPKILTGLPKYKVEEGWATEQKKKWAEQHFPGVEVITCLSENKRLHMKPGDILVDDLLRFSQLWIDAGGVFVHHLSAKQSIAKLQELGVL